MATTSIRPAVKSYLKTQLATALPTVTVMRSWNGKLIEREAIWFQRTSGEVGFPLAMAGRKARDDDFTVRVAFAVATPGEDDTEVEARVMELVAALENIVAADVTAANLDGLVHMILGQQDGPDSVPYGEGFLAMVEQDVVCKTRLL